MLLTYFDKCNNYLSILGAVTVNNEKCAKKCRCGASLCVKVRDCGESG